MLSERERDRRLAFAQELMRDKGLRALLITGNGCVGTRSYGCFRYLTDVRVYYHLQTALFFPGCEPVGVVGSVVSLGEAKGTFLRDCRIFPDTIEGVLTLLAENGVEAGRVGACMDIMPASWAERLRESLPGLELVDVANEFFAVRNRHSEEETELLRLSAQLADDAFAAVRANVHAGMTEQQVAAELEHAIQLGGGENNFTLISTGRFSFKDNQLPCIRAATMFNRVVEEGSCISMEITPRYQGYWTQLVRTVCVGEPNEDTRLMHALLRDSIADSLAEFRPGNPISNIAKRLRRFIEDAGYEFNMPCGHICGLDLDEEQLDEQNDRPLEVGMAVIVHPSITTPGIQSSIFWGQTYLITETGCEPLMRTGDELYSIN